MGYLQKAHRRGGEAADFASAVSTNASAEAARPIQIVDSYEFDRRLR